MSPVISFPDSAVSREELSRITADYLALDRLRVFRRLLVFRFGLMTVVTLIGGAFVSGISPFMRWVPVGLFLVPPTWAWIAELRLARRLMRRLDHVDQTGRTRAQPMQGAESLVPQKVIKNS